MSMDVNIHWPLVDQPSLIDDRFSVMVSVISVTVSVISVISVMISVISVHLLDYSYQNECVL